MPDSYQDNISPNNAEDRHEYLRAFRSRVFQLLKWGYERLDISKFKCSHEEDITGELAKQINSIVQDRDYPKWVGRFYVHEEYRINDAHRTGKKRKRIDIKISYVQYGPRPYYHFEAKRLSSTRNPISLYLGPEGLGEFLCGNYGRDSSEGGMIGYVQTGTTQQWADKAKNKLQSKPNNYQMCDFNDCKYVYVLKGLDFCLVSIHNRSVGNSPISIYHLFLDFCNDTNP